MTGRRTIDLAAIVAAEIMQGPRSLKALALALGKRDRSTDFARQYVEAFRSQGLIYVHSWWRNQYELWAWQPSPHFLPDAPKPLNHAERAERNAEIRRQEAAMRDRPLRKATRPGPNVPNSVFALGLK